MKKLIYTGIAIVALAAAIASCRKEFTITAVPVDLSNSAYLKVVHASPRFRQQFGLPDTINVFVAGQKINGAALTFGTTFPAGTNTYVAVPSGTQQIRLSVHGTTNPDSIQVTSLQKTFDVGQYYTFIITDSIASPRDSSQIFVRDAQPERVNPGYMSVRFVHAVFNDTAGSNVDIFSARRNGIIFPNVRPGTVTNFTTLSQYPGVADTLIVKRTGTNFELARLNAVSFGSQRIYTLTYRGNADSIPARRYGRGLLLSTNE